MQALYYDGSFEGWLTVVFSIFEYKWINIYAISANDEQEKLFGQASFIPTDEKKAARVWKGLEKATGQTAAKQVYQAFLSELPGAELKLYEFVRHVLQNGSASSADFGHPAVLFVAQTAKKVHREKHRMEAFVRFSLASDGLYYALIEPDFNVLPLISDHFEKRYADQRWMIYDTRRKQGLYYDLQQTHTLTLIPKSDAGKETDSPVICLDEQEEAYRKLWQQYFSSVNIQSRKNLKLHIQHMPRRYWKYLTEKKGR